MAEIVLDRVSKVYSGGVKGVDDLSLEISDGEFMVLVGPSGCGKSTALSGGQRQRVAMGRAIVREPRALIWAARSTSSSPSTRCR